MSKFIADLLGSGKIARLVLCYKQL